MAEVITLQQSNINYSHSEFLPDIVRVLEVGYEIDEPFSISNIVTVYGNAFQATLTWTSARHDEQITAGALARVYWPNKITEVNGHYPVVRLVPLTVADLSVNLFDTVPPSWSKDFGLLHRAKDLWEQLPVARQTLFNELFWDGNLFQRYVCLPASLDSQYNGSGGNLRHAVELAEHAERIALDVDGVSIDLLILAGLLYNAPLAHTCVWKKGQWSEAYPARVQESRAHFMARMDAILDCKPILLTEDEHQILREILLDSAARYAEVAVQPMAPLEIEILKMANRLSYLTNLRGQGGAQ